MKKNIVLLLALVAFVIGIPSVFAANNGPSDSEYTYLKLYINTEEGGDEYVLYTGDPDNVEVTSVNGYTYDVKTNTLTINDTIITNAELSLNMMGDDFKIKLIGTSELMDIESYGDGYGASIHFIGDGELYLNAYKEAAHAIYLYAEGTASSITIDEDASVYMFGPDGVIFSSENEHSKASDMFKPLNKMDYNVLKEDGYKSVYEDRGCAELEELGSFVILKNDDDYYGVRQISENEWHNYPAIMQYDAVNDIFFYTSEDWENGYTSGTTLAKTLWPEDVVQFEGATKKVYLAYLHGVCEIQTDENDDEYTLIFKYDDSIEDYVPNVYKFTDKKIVDKYTTYEYNLVEKSSLKDEDISYPSVKSGYYDYTITNKVLNVTPKGNDDLETIKALEEDSNNDALTELLSEDAESNLAKIAKIISDTLEIPVDDVDPGEINVVVEGTVNEIKNLPKSAKELFEKATNSVSGLKTAGFLSINIGLYYSGEKIANISELGKELSLEYDIRELLESLPKLADKMTRKFSLFRIHGDQVEEIPASVIGTKLKLSSKDYSDFIITYVDEPLEANPNTGDNIKTYMTLGLVSLISMAAFAIYIKKFN